jgi:hypothetical protein
MAVAGLVGHGRFVGVRRGLSRRRFVAFCGSHLFSSRANKKAITGEGDGLWSSSVRESVWLHHPLIVGASRPTLIRTRLISRTRVDTTVETTTVAGAE